MNIHQSAIALLLAATSLLLVAAPTFAEGPTYTGAPGDTLFKISSRLLGDGNRYLQIVQLTNKKHGGPSLC